MRNGDQNPNWRGGISSLKSADDVFSLSVSSQSALKRRLLSQIKKDPITKCWDWTGSIFNTNGRACLSLGRRHSAHRISYAVFCGPIGNKHVLHTCDNVLCINPKHLWLGTPADNSRDMVKKGRSLRGERNHAAMFTNEEVISIRQRVRSGEVQRVIAKEFGVSNNAINLIVKYRTWMHLP